jgi:radical SAM protein with 4Fe4S-binding SPASM domain
MPTLKKHNKKFCSENSARKYFLKYKKINNKLSFVSELFNYNNILKTCGAGKFKISILPDGTVLPCEWIKNDKKFACGNILKDSIKDIWYHKNMKKFRKRFNSKKNYSACDKCSKKRTCSSCPVPLINKVVEKENAICDLLRKKINKIN